MIKKLPIFLFHNKNFDDLEHLLKCTNKHKSFDIIAVVSETRISKKTSLTCNINFKNYSFKSTPTESSAGRTLLCCLFRIVSHKSCLDLNIAKKNQLESTLIEIINTKKAIVVGCIYKRLNMDFSEFNHLKQMLEIEKVFKEQEKIFLLGDFNINLLN